MLGLRLSWEDEREKHNPAAFMSGAFPFLRYLPFKHT